MANASSTEGISKVEFFVDGVYIDVDTDVDGGWTATWNLTGVEDGVYTLKATATAEDGQFTDAEITVQVNNVLDIPISIYSLTGSNAWIKTGVTWQAPVSVTVNPAVSGAVIVGRWSDGTISTCTTVEGMCDIVLGDLSKKLTSVTFTVTSISLAGYVYEASLNVISSVTVLKP